MSGTGGQSIEEKRYSCCFVLSLSVDFPRERVPVVLAPLLYQERQDIPEDRWVGQGAYEMPRAEKDRATNVHKPIPPVVE